MYHICITFAGNPIKYQEAVVEAILNGHGRAKMLSNEFINNRSTFSFFSQLWCAESTATLFKILPEKDLGTTISVSNLKALRNPLYICWELIRNMESSEIEKLYTHITGNEIIDLFQQSWIKIEQGKIPEALISNRRLKNFLKAYDLPRIAWDKGTVRLLIMGYGDKPQWSIEGMWAGKHSLLWKSNSPGGGVASMRLFIGKKTYNFGNAGYINRDKIVRKIRDAVGKYEFNANMEEDK